MDKVGAGIQLPPNATRVMAQYGLLDTLIKDGRAVALEKNEYTEHSTGEVIAARPGSEWAKRLFGYVW